MVGHQFYTHLNGVPVQVVKHSPSATYISHLYNPCAVARFLHFSSSRTYFKPPLDTLEVWKDRRVKEERDNFNVFLFTFILFPVFVSYICLFTLISLYFLPHWLSYSWVSHLKKVFIGILVVTGKTVECLNKLKYIPLLSVIVTHTHSKQGVSGRVHY